MISFSTVFSSFEQDAKNKNINVLVNKNNF